jgi:hypothetical protein
VQEEDDANESDGDDAMPVDEPTEDDAVGDFTVAPVEVSRCCCLSLQSLGSCSFAHIHTLWCAASSSAPSR